MNEITAKQDLLAIKGGFLSLGAISAIMGGIVFLIGLLDGYVRPLKCRRITL